MVAHALSLPALTVTAFATNLRGAQAALAASVHKFTNSVAASVAHSLANVRKTREQMVDEVRAIVTLKNENAPMVKVEPGVSMARGCTLQGGVAEDDVVRVVTSVVAAGVDHAGLSNTTG